jgi:hypothetical protein
LRAVLGGEFGEALALEKVGRTESESARLYVEQPSSELDAAGALFALQHVLDLAAGPGRRDICKPVADSGLCPAWVMISTMSPFCMRGAQRHHLAVDASADALIADVGVDAVGEVDDGRAARHRAHSPFGVKM